jgi:hypothetical protein
MAPMSLKKLTEPNDYRCHGVCKMNSMDQSWYKMSSQFFHFCINFIKFIPKGEVELWYFDKEYRRLLPKITTELCQLSTNIEKNPMMRNLLVSLRKSGTYPTKCPVKKV